MTTDGPRTDPMRIAEAIMTAAGHRDSHVPPIGELNVLARAYVQLVRSSDPSRQVQWHVSQRAAEQFAASARGYEAHEVERARRDLTRLLARHASRSQSDPEVWRCRARSFAMDISVRATDDNGLLVVSDVSVRELGRIA